MNKIRIRPMTIEDYYAVRTLWQSIKGFGIRDLDDSRDEIARFIQRNPTTSVIAEDGNKVVGSILCGSDGRQGSLYHVCVESNYRRQRIGTRMVCYCMKQLKTMGINKVALIAFSNNNVGNAFWKQMGWKKSDVNYYEFSLNDKNIVRFVGEVPGTERELN